MNIFNRLLPALFFVVHLFAIPATQAALPLEIDGENLPSLAPMLEQATPAVVNIATEGRIKQQLNPLFSDPFFRHFFQLPDQTIERKTNSLGSGVIVDAKRGLVLTNNHIITNAVQITVALNDGRRLEAEVVGTDPETDVAVIKIPAEKLIDLKPADSGNVRVGDFVVAIGNPFGLGQTVTSGIISALSRSGLNISGYEDFIQTDAPINPGNSGGALVNLHGKLVGINTAIFTKTGGSIGIGFAIPINLAVQIMEQLVNTGEVKRGFLGVNMQDISPSLAEAFGLDRETGAVINKVLKGSPAEKSGLLAGDIILSINGRPMENSAAVRNRIGLLPIGERLEFKLLRNGKTLTLDVTTTVKASLENSGPMAVNQLLQGVTFGDLDRSDTYFGKLEGGVAVVNVERGSIAWRSGLRKNDVITSVNKVNVKNMQEFLSAVHNKKDLLLLRVVRGNTASFLVIKK